MLRIKEGLLLAGLAWGGVVACGGDAAAGGDQQDGGAGSAGASGSAGQAGTAGTAGSSGSGGSGGLDCSTVGCAAPPRCDEGCTAKCGCCTCSEGERQPTDGGVLVCTGGCYTLQEPRSCGGRGGAGCEPQDFCDYTPEAACGTFDAPGQCKPRPQGCPLDCPGVCGCDGQFYCNACAANAQGVAVSPDQSCQDGGAAGTVCTEDRECGHGLKCCYPCGIPGCEHQCTVPESDGSCPLRP